MQYKYRWYYAVGISFSFLIAGFFYDEAPRWIQMTALQEKERKIREELLHLKQFVSRYPAEVDEVLHSHGLKDNIQPIYWEDIFTLAYESGLAIQSFNLLPQPLLGLHNINKVRLVMRGDFLQMVAFMEAITKQANSKVIVVTDFSYKFSPQKKFIINMDVMLVQNKLPMTVAHQSINYKAYNPFCGSAKDITYHYDIEELQRISLDQIKMIGYLQQTSHVSAIVASPSGGVFSIDLNTKLGVEQGVVIDIQRQYLMVKVNEKEERYIKMKGTV
jgi:hypothetical protein